jgi:hypothetical protein
MVLQLLIFTNFIGFIGFVAIIAVSVLQKVIDA